MNAFWTRLVHTWKRSAGNRREFFHELYLSLDARMEPFYTRKVQYDARSFVTVLQDLENITQTPLQPFLHESHLADIDMEIRRRSVELGHKESGETETYARQEYAELYYILCRAFRPRNVLETGVAYGRSSAYILKALEVNGNGTLHSVDRPLPVSNANELIGVLVPDSLRHHWQLHIGSTHSLFPALLPSIGKIDIFIHDSRHTYRNMKYEFGTVIPYLNNPGFVLSDDADQNPAFHEWASRTTPTYWTTMAASGNRLLGISFLRT